PGRPPPGSTPPGPGARPSARWPGCRWRSRTCSAPSTSRRPAGRGSSTAGGRPTAPRWCPACGRRGRSSSARPTSTSSPWAHRPRTRGSSPPPTPGTSAGFPAGRRGAARRRWPPASHRWPSAPTPAARSANRRRCAAWSGYGIVAYASSLDQAGPFATTVADTALLLEAMWGHDPRDSTSIPSAPEPLLASLENGVAGLRIGVVEELTDVDGIQPDVRAAVDSARALLEKAGAEVDTVSVPSVEYGLSAYYIIAPAEASSNLARYDGVRYGLRVPAPEVEAMNASTREAGFGAEVKRRIMLGTYALSAGYYDAYYGQAQRVRTLIIRDFARAYER